MAKILNGETDTASGPSAWVLRWLGRPHDRSSHDRSSHGRPGGSPQSSPQGSPHGSATVLDFASGAGRHVGPAVAAGYRVLAADRDSAALAQAGARGARIMQADLEGERWPFTDERFEVVVMTRYLHRERLALLLGLVEPGGRFIGETFARGNERWGRPRNPAFLLEPDELFHACRRAGLVVLAFEQGATVEPGPAVIQRVVAIRPPFDPLAWPLRA